MAGDLRDDKLRDRLREAAGDGAQSDGSALQSRPGQLPPDPSDEALRKAVSDYHAPGPVEGWDLIAIDLEHADRIFDASLRQRMQTFGATEDSHAWPRFIGYWRDSRLFRTKLLLLKSIEAMTLLLLFLVFSEYGAFEIPPEARHPAPTLRPSIPPLPYHHDNLADAGRPVAGEPCRTVSSPPVQSGGQPGRTHPRSATTPETTIAGIKPTDIPQRHFVTPVDPILGVEVEPAAFGAGQIEAPGHASHPGESPSVPDFPENSAQALPARLAMVPFSGLLLHPSAADRFIIPAITPAASRPCGHAELSLLVLNDLSALRMPEDRIYSIDQQVIFPEKRLYARGYGGGFTIASSGHPRLALETGLIYSSRTFRPGRTVVLGSSVDNSTVDFEALRLQLITLPMQGRYRLDHTGRIQTYLAGGMSFTVVAQSDLDVFSSYSFTSLAQGADPKSDPVLARTLRETQRISEHLRDNTPFKTKNYLSLQAGAGVEYVLTNHNKFFLQVLAQYQIPNVEFSKHNGKDLRAMALQAGMRTLLGK